MENIRCGVLPSVLLLALGFADARSAGAQTAPGYVVSIYATGVTRPAAMSFDTTGNLYVGNGLNTGPVKISRVSPGGAPVVEYGASGIDDPDSVLFDPVGSVSGTAGSVLVGGGVGSLGKISVIHPDESITTLFGPALPLRNPSDMKFTGSGDVVISEFGGVGTGGLYALSPGGVVTSLASLTNPNELEIDDGGLIYVSGSDGTIRVFNADGSPSNPALVTGLGTSQLLALAPGNGFGSDLYAIDHDSGVLLRVATDGLSGPELLGSGFTGVGGMEFGPDGALYVAMNAIGEILRIVLDSDDDGVADEDDPCLNDGSRNITVSPKLLVKKIAAETNPGNDGLQLKGEFVSATAFSNLDPLSNGIRVLLVAGDGTVRSDITIPGGAGWSVSGTKLRFSDSEGLNDGITKIQIQDRNTTAPNQVRVQITGRDGTYPVEAGDEPLRAIVVVGDGAAGECGETAFAAEDCAFNGAGNLLKCQ